MKKSILFCVLFCGLFGSTVVYGEQESTAEVTQSESQKEVTKAFVGRGDIEKERIRQRRVFRYSSLEASGLYAEKGDHLTVVVKDQDALELVIGTPERNTQKKYPLLQGTNEINVETEGAIYVVNPNEDGSALVTIKGATGQMPFFDLNTTSVEDFQTQMAAAENAKDVQLISNKAIVTVSYRQAQKNITDPKELMEYYDKFLVAQDRVSGISSDGRPENRVDRHFQHFIEVSRKYMFSTQEYMGFNGDGALARLLKTNNGWGVWHESGHQRQQDAWRWDSVIESSVNIYSMAAQKETSGKITALDSYYPQMHTYLTSENKDFEKQNNDLKMVMFGQLANTFGENFYPVLHQYYRENNLSYSTDAERIQNFVINVSKVTGYNMVPYFEEWGFAITEPTRSQTDQLLDLPEKIWLNDNQSTKKLPMRMIDKVTLSDTGIKVDLTDFDTNVFQDQTLVVIKNDQEISKLINKQSDSTLNDNTWQITTPINSTDNIRIELRNTDGVFHLYNRSLSVEQLRNTILGYLDSQEPLDKILTQEILDGIRTDIATLADTNEQQKLLSSLEKLENNYLSSLVKDLSLDESGNLLVTFTNSKFKEYKKIVILGNGKYIAEVANGKPYYSSLSDKTLKVSDQKNQADFSVQFRLPHKTYTVAGITSAEMTLKKEINALFITDHQLNDNVTQEKLDDLRSRISSVSAEFKKPLTDRINKAQQLFFESMISSLDFKNSKVTVSFSNDLYKNYKIVVLENKKYMAEVTDGKAYYGQLNGLVFTTSKKATSGVSYVVEVRHASGNYRMRENTFN